MTTCRKILVTGGAGSVGTHLVKALLGQNHKVIVLDDLSNGNLANLPQSNLLEFVEGSVCNDRLVQTLVREVDMIYHLAARNIIASVDSPRTDFEVNVGGTVNVLMAAREKGTKVVYISSASVYGNAPKYPVCEEDVLCPTLPYSTSKLAGEHYSFAFHKTYGLPVACIRYSNVYGTSYPINKHYYGLVPKLFESAKMGRPPQIYGDGEQTRDFTYISDAVDATILCGTSDKAIGRVYNVGTGVEISINQVASLIMELYGHDFQPVYINQRRVDTIQRRVVSIDRIQKELGWYPKVSIKRGLELIKEELDRKEKVALEPRRFIALEKMAAAK